jgi:hypothetical protein
MDRYSIALGKTPPPRPLLSPTPRPSEWVQVHNEMDNKSNPFAYKLEEDRTP